MIFFSRVISFLILFFIMGCVATTPPMNFPVSEPPSHHLKKLHPNVVLVLGSGSARGFAHAGVIKVLEKNHIPIDMIVGTSAGSIVGALYADNPSANALQQLLLTTPRDDVIDFSLLNIAQGPISGTGLQHFLINHLQARSFDQLRIPFIAVATDLDTGQLHTFSSGSIALAVNASSAAPPFFRPVKIYGKTYVDGGLIDPVAVDVARQFHPKLIIAVNLNYCLSKNIPSHCPGVFLRGFDMLLMRLNDYTAAKADIIIRPIPSDEVSMFDSSKRTYMMRIGEEAAEKAIPSIKKLLHQRHITSVITRKNLNITPSYNETSARKRLR